MMEEQDEHEPYWKGVPYLEDAIKAIDEMMKQPNFRNGNLVLPPRIPVCLDCNSRNIGVLKNKE